MANLTQAQLREMLEKNPELVIEDNGVTMGAEEPPQNFRDILHDIMIDNMLEAKLQAMQTIEDEPGPKFKSKTEARAYEWLPEETGCLEIFYEPIMVRMNSGSYTPDFMLRMPDRELWFIEVKGSYAAYQSGRSSKKSLKEAAKMYWFLGRWFSLLPVPKKEGGGWTMEEIK